MPRKQKDPPTQNTKNARIPKSKKNAGRLENVVATNGECVQYPTTNQSMLRQINHPVSFVPILDYESIFKTAHVSQNPDVHELNNDKTDIGIQNPTADDNIRLQAIRNLESDPSLIHIFHERNERFMSASKKFESGTSSNNATIYSKRTPQWTLIKRHSFYHNGFYESTNNLESHEQSSVDINPSQSLVSFPNLRLKDGAFPVYSQCTCMTSITLYSTDRTTAFEYVALGDSAGYVTLYTISPLITAVNRLETSASQREYLEDKDLFKERLERRKRNVKRSGIAKNISGEAVFVRTLDNKTSISSQCQNAIEILCFTSLATHIIVGTKWNMECIHCNTGVIQWTIPFSSIPGRFVSGESATSIKFMTRDSITRLDAHPWFDDGGILASFTLGSTIPENETSSLFDNSHTSPCLYFPTSLRSSCGPHLSMDQFCDIIPKTNSDINSDVLCIGPYAFAIWDRSKQNRILAFFLTMDGSVDPSNSNPSELISFKHELFLMQHDNLTIICRIELPTKLSGSKYTLNMAMNQSENGTFSIVTSAKTGIRLFRTEGLEPLAVYGEGISLHGFTINWQDCFFMKWGKVHDSESLTSSVKQWRRGQAREREDEIHYRAMCEQATTNLTQGTHDKDSFCNLFIVGVPCAFKEPLEVNDTIHFWDLSGFDFVGGQKLPSFTLKVPGKHASINGLNYFPGRLDGENGKFLLVTQSGDFFRLTSSLVSDWAGPMYDPGYQLVDDNIIFIEDEDAVDIPIDSIDNPQNYYGNQINPSNSLDIGGRVDHNQIFLTDLETALQLSVVDHNVEPNEDGYIDIMAHDDGDPFQYRLLCHPEPFLQERVSCVANNSSSSAKSKVTGDGSMDFIDLFPNATDALGYLENEKTKLTKRLLPNADSNDCGQQANDGSVRKRKQNEAFVNMMNALLRESLTDREVMATGSGCFPSSLSSLSATQKMPDSTEGCFICLACRGRMVRHVCGRRNVPVDHASLNQSIPTKKETVKAKKSRSKVNKVLSHIKSESIVKMKEELISDNMNTSEMTESKEIVRVNENQPYIKSESIVKMKEELISDNMNSSEMTESKEIVRVNENQPYIKSESIVEMKEELISDNMNSSEMTESKEIVRVNENQPYIKSESIVEMKEEVNSDNINTSEMTESKEIVRVNENQPHIKSESIVEMKEEVNSDNMNTSEMTESKEIVRVNENQPTTVVEEASSSQMNTGYGLLEASNMCATPGHQL